MDVSPELLEVRDQCLSFLDTNSLCLPESDKNWRLIQSGDVENLWIWQFTGTNKTWNNPSIICVRGKLRFPDTVPEEVLNTILRLDERPKWDAAMLRGEIRKAFSPRHDRKEANQGCDIAHLEYKGMPLVVSPRDLCLFRYWENEPASAPGDVGKAVLVAKSVEHPTVPPTDVCVRADLMECGYIMQEGVAGGERYTDVTYISSLDLKGSLPTSLVNVILKQQPATLLQIRQLLGKGVAKENGCCLM